ncbi:MAG: hypothetical protein J0L70_03105 [Leptolyngbya sp. UWPOB_LEPTO1]|uniref:hypothetical protein n=1 Tax=Leptolyngbya sp. UWPOB_LEPTO1 TaxID=2815653 RepID=UPI001AD5E456|nr:hypothetical protein [Leptolyngbya sp. UWPOB_LEPTO1]MBN8559491.1 hypothetical protein [Leptolyngbya sp. UWPOB_LEPTO1]
MTVKPVSTDELKHLLKRYELCTSIKELTSKEQAEEYAEYHEDQATDLLSFQGKATDGFWVSVKEDNKYTVHRLVTAA